MLGLGAATRIYVATGATDMSLRFDGLYGLVAGSCSRTHRSVICLNALSIAAVTQGEGRRVRITHPFHPLYGEQFELILTQVKYEMLRRVQKDEMPISTVAASFGVSCPAFYKALQDFAREGLAGPISRRRGPKEGHKVTAEVLAFVEQIRAQETSVTNARAAAENSEGVCPPSTPQNRGAALASAKETDQAAVAERGSRSLPSSTTLTEHYETLRGCVLERKGSSGMRLGQGALMARVTGDN